MKRVLRRVALSFAGVFGVVWAYSAIAAPGDFTVIYVDRSGLQWSQKLPGKYSNGCTTPGDWADDTQCTVIKDGAGNASVGSNSLAAQACAQIGGVLPSREQYWNLIKDFDYELTDGVPVLSARGLTDLQNKFGDMLDWFWTSTIAAAGPNVFEGYAYFFYGNQGFVEKRPYISSRDHLHLGVRCVKGR